MNRAPRIAIVSGLVLASTLAHVLIPHHAHVWHDFLFKATYIPIVLAGLWFGKKGGVATALATSVLHLAHVQFQLGGHLLTANLGRTLDIALYNLVAVVTGHLSTGQSRARRRAEDLAEEQAALRSRLEKSYEALRQQTVELFQAEEQLRRSERLAALGELTASIAHELRTPVSGITGAAEIVSRENVAQETRAEFAEILRQEARRLERFVRGILDFARTHQPEVSEVNVREVAERVFALVRKEAERAGVSLANESPGDIHLRADPFLLEQILLNLTLNAVQAMPSGGTVRVGAFARGGELVVLVSDEGPGMSAEERERAFEPFFTTKSSGTGLGLSIVRRIVRRMGGEVAVRSSPGQGTQFAVTLPSAPKSGNGGDAFPSRPLVLGNGTNEEGAA